MGEVGEARAAVVGLAQAVALDHGAHRPVEHQDSAGEQRAQAGLDGGGLVRGDRESGHVLGVC